MVEKLIGSDSIYLYIYVYIYICKCAHPCNAYINYMKHNLIINCLQTLCRSLGHWFGDGLPTKSAGHLFIVSIEYKRVGENPNRYILVCLQNYVMENVQQQSTCRCVSC